MTRPWSSSDDAVMREYYPQGGYAQCMELLPGRTMLAVFARARRLGLCVSRPCGAERQSWPVRPEIDDALRALHRKVPGAGEVRALAKTFGRPVWWMSHRARRLGLATPRQMAAKWSDAEVRILRACEDLSGEAVRRRLRVAGFVRPLTDIEAKRKRLRLPAAGGGYSARELADLLGIDDSAVLRWIRQGSLKATQANGCRWRITDAAVRDFAVAHPLRLEFRRLPVGHQPWLIGVLAGRECE